MCLVGEFTAGGLCVDIQSGKVRIVEEGKARKFIDSVEEITFSGEHARAAGKEVLYITERAVFKLLKTGVTLVEIAPGIDFERDILSQMEFIPQIADDLHEMDKRIFREAKMSIRNEILSRGK